ncbi:MAG: glycosyltransferase [Oscillatoriales cyanobacterium SM2_3_0]|nr:glycosyltransferase [Oscillatoriales cyanobacterium SM2_3_0]
MTNPGVWDTQTKTSYLPQSAQLQGILIKLFRPFVQQETVTLAVETKVARQEFEALTTLPFIQLPHPVANVDLIVETVDYKNSLLNFACFGFARYEKGSDLFKQAIEQFIYQFKSDHLQFYIQWIEPFDLPDGTVCNPNSLSDLAQVKVIDRPLVTDAYQALLKTTDCMVLPYRNSSYYARVSRIAIESTFLGIPMIYTKGGWLEDLVQEFGAGIGIEDENIDELIAAIQTMSNSYSHYRQAALIQQEKTRVYFSGQAFCQMLLEAV